MKHHYAPPSAAGADKKESHSVAAEGVDPDNTVVWRLRLLRSAGFSDTVAHLLAATPGTDIHALLALVDRGCPPELAARILGPSDLGRRE